MPVEVLGPSPQSLSVLELELDISGISFVGIVTCLTTASNPDPVGMSEMKLSVEPMFCKA